MDIHLENEIMTFPRNMEISLSLFQFLLNKHKKNSLEEKLFEISLQLYTVEKGNNLRKVVAQK